MVDKIYKNTRYLLGGDRSLIIEFGDAIDKVINKKVRKMAEEIASKSIGGIIEIIPSFRSIQIIYDPLDISYKNLKAYLRELEGTIDTSSEDPKRIIQIPVAYGGQYGPDIEGVGKYTGLPIKDLIKLHSSKDYFVYMLGFSPGFPYLGGMDPSLETPRLEKPRIKIPKGSVAIGGKQTGIYPMASPGGWQIIGKTPLNLFDPKKDPPVLVEAGAYIRFLPIGEEEFLRIEALVRDNKYRVNIIKEGYKNGEN